MRNDQGNISGFTGRSIGHILNSHFIPSFSNENVLYFNEHLISHYKRRLCKDKQIDTIVFCFAQDQEKKSNAVFCSLKKETNNLGFTLVCSLIRDELWFSLPVAVKPHSDDKQSHWETVNTTACGKKPCF